MCVRAGGLSEGWGRRAEMFEMKAQSEHLPCKRPCSGSLLSGASNGGLQGQGQCFRQGKAFLVPRQLPTVGMVPGARHSPWPLQLRVQTGWHYLVPRELPALPSTTHPLGHPHPGGALPWNHQTSQAETREGGGGGRMEPGAPPSDGKCTAAARSSPASQGCSLGASSCLPPAQASHYRQDGTGQGQVLTHMELRVLIPEQLLIVLCGAELV